MNTKFEKLTASIFTPASSSGYTMIEAPEGIGSLAGEDPHRGFSKFWTWQITIPAEDPAPPVPSPRPCTFFVGADDFARLEIGNGNIAELLPRGPQGGGPYAENHGNCMLLPGVYNVSLSYDNIDYDPAKNNAASLAFGISCESNPTYPEKALPNDNTPISTPKPCPCNHCSSNNQGGKKENITKSPKSKSSAPLLSTYGSSSAGSENIAFADDNNMYWSCNFGCFRGMGSLPQGNFEILAYQMSSRCYQIDGLNYSHPLHTRLLLPSGGIETLPNALLTLQNGERKDHYPVQGDGISICKVGTSSLSNNHVLFLDMNFQPLNHTNSSSIPYYLQVINPDKSSCLYSLSTGSLSHYISPTQIRHSRAQLEEDLQIIKQNDGSLYQIWNRWDGLAQVQDISDSGYSLALYLPSQVRDKNPVTRCYSIIGEPFKQYRISQDLERQGFSISEEATGHSPFRHTWWQQGEAWCMSQGEEDEAIITRREKTILPDSQEWELITSISQGNNTVSITAERYKNSTEGNLLLCKTEAYGSPDAQITYYEYDGQGLLTREIRPDEARYEYVYDHYGRIRKSLPPWLEATTKSSIQAMPKPKVMTSTQQVERSAMSVMVKLYSSSAQTTSTAKPTISAASKSITLLMAAAKHNLASPKPTSPAPPILTPENASTINVISTAPSGSMIIKPQTNTELSIKSSKQNVQPSPSWVKAHEKSLTSAIKVIRPEVKRKHSSLTAHGYSLMPSTINTTAKIVGSNKTATQPVSTPSATPPNTTTTKLPSSTTTTATTTQKTLASSTATLSVNKQV